MMKPSLTTSSDAYIFLFESYEAETISRLLEISPNEAFS